MLPQLYWLTNSQFSKGFLSHLLPEGRIKSRFRGFSNTRHCVYLYQNFFLYFIFQFHGEDSTPWMMSRLRSSSLMLMEMVPLPATKWAVQATDSIGIKLKLYLLLEISMMMALWTLMNLLESCAHLPSLSSPESGKSSPTSMRSRRLSC